MSEYKQKVAEKAEKVTKKQTEIGIVNQICYVDRPHEWD